MLTAPGRLQLSALRGLWGNVTPDLRKVSIEFKENTIYMYFYYDKEVTPEVEELAEDSVTEVISDYPDTVQIESEIMVVNYPEKINHKGYLIYYRYEPTPSNP